MQDGLGLARAKLTADAKDVATLFDVVLKVIVGALVRELGHFSPTQAKKRLVVIAKVDDLLF